MTTNQITYNQNFLSGWLIRTVLLFGIFSFSGHVNASIAELPVIATTEIIVDSEQQQSQNSLPLSPIYSSIPVLSAASYTFFSFSLALPIFNKIIHSLFKSATIKCLSFSILFRFLCSIFSTNTIDEFLLT